MLSGTVRLIFLIVAIVLFALATGAPGFWPNRRYDLIAAGLFFYALKDLP